MIVTVMENNLYIGIDPGKDGFFCIIWKQDIVFHAIPTIGKAFDIQELSKIINSIELMMDLADKTYCVIENVHAVFGSSAESTFTFGFGCGLIEGMLGLVHIPYTKIQPKKWQGQMFEGVQLQTKPSSVGKPQKTDTKKMAEVAAKRIFPDIDFRASERCVNSHDGKVDALLMAEYARRNF
jgi:hypothetical protein